MRIWQNQLRLQDTVHRCNVNIEKDKASWEWEKSLCEVDIQTALQEYVAARKF
jgi:hypothetical protein